ncbi:MAG: glycosyltransferase, partial [Balneolaceae bacterium]|nr:glycosyltransferase [Balneolaceae bacterium]
GTPRSALEAMAIGRPIITTDHPGCRETVVEGENGFLIPVQDSNALATAMERFINDPSLILKYGQKSRQMAEDLYDVRKVNRFMMDEMGLLKVEGCKLLVVPTTRDHAKERGWFRR